MNLDCECGNVFLPQSTNLTGSIKNNGVELSLNIASEIGITRYIIERKTTNGFLNIGFLTPQGQTRYFYNDELAGNGKNIYRIKIIKLDGSYGFTNEVSIDYKRNKAARIYPNPSSEDVFIQINNNDQNKFEYELYNSLGQIVDHKNLNNANSNIFVINKKPAGFYILKIKNLTKQTEESHQIIFK